MRLLAVIWAIIVLAASPAHAEKRVALVIGNKDYKTSVGPLANPLNDIRLVSDALRRVGFEVLTPVQNANRNEMLRAVYALASSLKAAGPDAVGFLYYSGHGAASQGENYLIPVDVTEPSTEQLRIQGVKQSEVLAILRDEAPNAAHYLVLDACRNNLQGARGGKGFVAVGQQNGVLVAFSTEPGKTAQDTGAESGPYAAALAAELVKPGQNDLLMFHNIRVDVMDKTKGDQVPWTEDGIERRQRPVFAPDVPATAAVTRQPPSSEAAQAWAAIKDTKISADIEIFLRRYPEGFYSDLARQRLPQLKALEAVAQEEARLKMIEMGRELKNRIAAASPPVTSANPCSSQAPTTVSLSSRLAQPLSAAEECSLKPKDVFKECDKCPEMVVVPAGSFTMGSPSNEGLDNERPQHTVTISKPFGVGKFLVTVAQFTDFVRETGYEAGSYCWTYEGEGGSLDMREGRSFANPGFSQTGSQPVVCLNMDDAKAYLGWLSKRTGKPYRLLTEAEWEYAARARIEPGSYPRYFFGDNKEDICRYDNTGDQAFKKKFGGLLSVNCNDGYVYTAPVGSFLPNAFGVYDIHGNARQLVEDCWHDNYQGAPTDGSAWTTGECRAGTFVLRGGAWHNDAPLVTAANRALLSGRFSGDGFRVARTLSP